LTILKKLRSTPETKKLPVILLTAKSSEFDKIKGLDLGADDYLTKPFGILELISRINAVLRRSGGEQELEKQLEFGNILVDNSRREVTVTGETIDLTFKEYELLHFLMLNKGLALNRGRIIEEVWGYDFEGESRTLDMHIYSLRQKLGAAGDNIKTIRNVGYRLGE
jgi:two-component system alkaline phosphatase synthesis response regulator PhoP